MAFKFHDNNSHHESLTDWMKRNVFIHKQPITNKIHITVIGGPNSN